jgi:hypothetical protein
MKISLSKEESKINYCKRCHLQWYEHKKLLPNPNLIYWKILLLLKPPHIDWVPHLSWHRKSRPKEVEPIYGGVGGAAAADGEAPSKFFSHGVCLLRAVPTCFVCVYLLHETLYMRVTMSYRKRTAGMCCWSSIKWLGMINRWGGPLSPHQFIGLDILGSEPSEKDTKISGKKKC